MPVVLSMLLLANQALAHVVEDVALLQGHTAQMCWKGWKQAKPSNYNCLESLHSCWLAQNVTESLVKKCVGDWCCDGQEGKVCSYLVREAKSGSFEPHIFCYNMDAIYTHCVEKREELSDDDGKACIAEMRDQNMLDETAGLLQRTTMDSQARSIRESAGDLEDSLSAKTDCF